MRAYIGGTFDLLHRGHIKLFEWAKSKRYEVCAVVNSDEFVERYKGKRPVINFLDRMLLLRYLKCVDYVFPNVGDENSKPSIRIVKPHVIIAGSDWTKERLMKQMQLTNEFLQEHMIDIIIFKDSDPLHSSDIRKKVE